MTRSRKYIPRNNYQQQAGAHGTYMWIPGRIPPSKKKKNTQTSSMHQNCVKLRLELFPFILGYNNI